LSKSFVTPILVLKSIIYSVVGFVMGFMVGVNLGILALFVVGISSGGSMRGAGDVVFIVMVLSMAAGAICGLVAAYLQEHKSRETKKRGD